MLSQIATTVHTPGKTSSPPMRGAAGNLSRRAFLMAAGTAAVSTVCAKVAAAQDETSRSAWNATAVTQQARKLAQAPFKPAPKLPRSLQALNYDRYRLVAFEHANAIWKQTRSPFWLECFHRGYLFNEKVDLHLIEQGAESPLRFQRKLFQYRGQIADLAVPDDIGFAGFRLLSKFETSPHFLEIASFVGASYFRAIGEGQVYGTSARGLAVNVGMAKPEEFPAFREFWIERPEPGAKSIRFWALLDSPSLTGAYEFNLRPSVSTTCDVKAKLFFRAAPQKLGLAPLTSMWMWGDGRPGPQSDPRPHVHDADGVMIHTAEGEWIWRPLMQQPYPSVTHYDFAGVRGFGLLQRERDPKHYLDDEAKYHARPSVWIEPKKGWAAGAVELLELPADHEGIDNVAVWWVPQQKIRAGDTLDFEYTISFTSREPQQTLARTVATRVSRADKAAPRIEIDFAGEKLASLEETAEIRPHVHVERGEVRDIHCEKQTSGNWRLSFAVHPAGDESAELRAVLNQAGDRLTETWRYLCPN